MSARDPGWYYCSDGASAIGPVPLGSLQQLISTGAVDPHHWVRHASWDRWFTVQEAGTSLRSAPNAGPVAGGGASVGADVSAVQRIASWVIDAAVFAVVTLLLNAILPSVFATLVAFCALVGYLVVLPMKGFATAGHVAIGLRVRTIDRSDTIDWLALGTRAAVVMLLAAPCLIGVVCSGISMVNHDSARAWHDVASGTKLVKVKPFDFTREPIARKL